MVRRRVLGLLGFAIAALLFVGVAAVWLQINLTSKHEHQSADSVITIEQGMGTREIVNRLANAGVVTDRNALLLWLTVTGQGRSLKAGDYEFPSPISAVEVIDKIRKGEVATRKVTIPEGYNRFDIASTLAEKTGLATKERFLALTGAPTLIKDIDPDARSLEGYLFPDTYEYTPKTTPEELIKQMVTRFRDVYNSKPEFSQRAAERNLTLHQIMTMASMVEEEARVDEERPVVASVFYNRLAKDMKLASDPTFVYAALLADDYDGDVNNPKHRARLSPYNTYQYDGLPPGPITNPGWKSIQAALEPADTQYLYFVVNGTEGRHKFSRTVEEHEAAVAEYRKLQQQQREAAQQRQAEPATDAPAPAGGAEQ
jgi:UPF0755 protein